MKKAVSVLFIAFLLVFSQYAESCVGKVFSIGILNSPDEQMLAEMFSILLNERTGTTVSIRYYKDQKDLYSATKKGEVGMLIENTDRAMEILGMPVPDDIKKAYDIARDEFRKKLNLVWLNPFGPFVGVEGKRQRYYSPVITSDVLNNFPALPRLINKLGRVIDEEVFLRMIKTVQSGEKPRKIARDVLKAKRII